ncbi:MAG: hypothetical protein JWR80_10002 [Bradyrhizobium sp.]|nr:hypothetical protein [Bradyrhizobium sp.]
MANEFDKIITSTPANATAGRVMSKGVHFEPSAPLPPNYPHWKEPPPLKQYSGPDHRGLTPDFIGKKAGRLTVLGILHNEAMTSGVWRSLRWVVKCTCGAYEARSSKALKNLIDVPSGEYRQGDRCFPCMKTREIQEVYKKKGARPISDFTGERR